MSKTDLFRLFGNKGCCKNMTRLTHILLLVLLSIVAWPTQAQSLSTAEDYFNRGYDRRVAGDLAGAIADYTRAIRIDPRYADAYFNRGNARDDKGDHDGAIADYTKYLELKPSDPDGYYNRGYARDSKGDHDGAIADLNKYLALNPSDPNGYFNRGNARFNKKDFAGAIADYTKYLELNPSDPDAYYNRGNARDDNGDHDGAIDDLNRAIELNPGDPDPYYNRAYVRNVKGEVAGAIADYTKYVEMAPRDPDGHNAVAWLLATTAAAQLRNGKKALQQALKAASLSNWRDPSILDTLAAAYAESGNFPAAILWENKACRSENSRATNAPKRANDCASTGRGRPTARIRSGHSCLRFVSVILLLQPERREF